MKLSVPGRRSLPLIDRSGGRALIWSKWRKLYLFTTVGRTYICVDFHA